MRQHQLLALLAGASNRTKVAKSEIYKIIQKPALFAGISRTYEPHDDEGYQYPPEISIAQQQAWDLLEQFEEACADWFDLAATQDKTNCVACADIVVDDRVLLEAVPVTHLLFLETQLKDVMTFINTLPVLPEGKTWIHNPANGLYETEPRLTTKTKKIMRPVVLYEATEQHPAQVKEATEDVPEGNWKTVESSSALSSETLKALRTKIDKLYRSVLVAREEANSIEVVELKTSAVIFGYLFDSALPS